MKKAIFRKSLALLLSVMVLLTALGGALSVFADDAAGDATIPEDYVLASGGSDLVGTEEAGIHGDYTAFGYLHAKVILGLPNADFQKGFQYWAGKTNEGPSVDFNLVTEANGNKYIQFNGSQADTYEGLATPDIAISDEYLNDGDQLALIFKYKATENDWQNVFAQRCLVEGDNAVRTANYNVKKLGYAKGGWNIGAIQSNLTVAARSDKTFLGGAETGYYTFYICMENTTATATSAFDDFEIVKVVNDKYYNIYTGEEIVYKNGTNTGVVLNDGGKDLVGTEEAGITDVYGSVDAYHAKVIEGMPNGDFSQGLKYWGGATATGPSADFNIVTDADGNKYIQFNGEQASAYKGLRSPDIAVADEYIDDGDELALIFDYKGDNSDWQNVFGQRNSSAAEIRTNKNNVKKLAYNNGWITGAIQTNLVVGTRTSTQTYPGTLNSGYYTFKIVMENTNTAATTAFDNFRIAKVVDGKYYDLYTGEQIVFTSTSYPDGQPLGGTAEEGVIASGGANYVGNTSGSLGDLGKSYQADSFMNADFSEGFKYWSIRYNSSQSNYNSINDIFTLTEDGIKLTALPANYMGLVSVPFKFDGLAAGDTIGLGFTSKGKSSQIQAWIKTYNTDGTTSSYTVYNGTPSNTADFELCQHSHYNSVLEKQPLYMWIDLQFFADTAVGFEIGSFMVGKVNPDGTWTNAATGEIGYHDGQQIGGTVEAGLNTSGSAIGNYKLDAPVDFTNGFKYWSSKHDRNGTAADQFELVVDDEGDYAFTVKSTNISHDGIETYRFSLEEGKTYAIMYDYKLNASLNKDLSTAIGGQPITVRFLGGTTVDSNSIGSNGVTFGQWTTDISGTLTAAADTYYYIQIQMNGKTGADIYAAVTDGEAPFLIKNIKIVEVLSSGNYLDVATGIELYSNGQVIGGTAQDGIVPDYKYSTKLYVGMNGATSTSYYGSTEGFNNGDFSDGLRFWAAKYDRTGYLLADGVSTIDKASDIAEIVDGKLTIKATYAGVADDEGKVTGAVQYAGVQSAPFTLKDSGIMVGDKLYLRLDALTTGGAKVQFVSKNSGSITVQPYNTTAWETHVSKPSYSEETGIWSNQIIVSSLDEVYALVVEVGDTVGGTQLDNLEILRADRGGVDKAVTLDGKLLKGDLYGDANGDGKVDLIDLVRAKKHAVDNSTPVFTAAADIDLSGVVDATDYTEIIDYILGTKAPAEGVA